MLVGTIRRILHNADVHRFSNRYTNRLSGVIIDEAGRTFEENIARVLENIELAKRLQRVVAAALHPYVSNKLLSKKNTFDSLPIRPRFRRGREYFAQSSVLSLEVPNLAIVVWQSGK